MVRKKWSYEINPEISNELKTLKKAVLVGAPHTSNIDAWHAIRFLTNKKIREIIPFGKIKIGMKKEAFIPVFSYIFKKLNLIPVDRSNPKKFWESLQEIFNQEDEIFWALSPEGTRSFREEWKSGFIRTAEKFNTPLIIAYMDYHERKVRIEKIISQDSFLTNGEIDMKKLPNIEKELSQTYQNITPKNSDQFNTDIKIRYKKKN